VEPFPNLNQPPAKTLNNNPTTKVHNPQMDLCLKMTKKWDCEEFRVFGKNGGIREMGEEGGAVAVGGGSERPAVVRW
jgi:hypothetical protein